MRKLSVIIFSLLLVMFTIGCKKTETTQNISVFVSILPQKYFIEKIAGDRIKAKVLVSPGKNPATYEPTPQQVTDLGNAKALFTIGVPFENAFLPKIQGTLKSLRIFDTSNGITKRMLESHSHEGEEEHHGTLDPHIWLSPSLVKIQAKNIYNALIEIDPSGKSDYKNGYESFIHELDELITDLQKTLKPFAGSTLFVFHPAFGYFADEFGLKQIAIETGGKEPSSQKLTEIIEYAQKEKVKIIFVQPEFSQESAKNIAKAISGTVIMLNPLDPDYINNLKSISTEIKKAYR